MTAHDIIDYLKILALAISVASGSLWYLTRNEHAYNVKREREYDESRRYPD